MKSKLIYLSSALLGLVACFSCNEKEKEMVSVIETTHVYDNNFVGLETLIPDLVIYEDIKYDEELGYYSSFRDEEWASPCLHSSPPNPFPALLKPANLLPDGMRTRHSRSFCRTSACRAAAATRTSSMENAIASSR